MFVFFRTEMRTELVEIIPELPHHLSADFMHFLDNRVFPFHGSPSINSSGVQMTHSYRLHSALGAALEQSHMWHEFQIQTGSGLVKGYGRRMGFVANNG
jgi:hypothetical protein